MLDFFTSSLVVTADKLAAFLSSENHDSLGDDHAKVHMMMGTFLDDASAVAARGGSSNGSASFTSQEVNMLPTCSTHL